MLPAALCHLGTDHVSSSGNAAATGRVACRLLKAWTLRVGSGSSRSPPGVPSVTPAPPSLDMQLCGGGSERERQPWSLPSKGSRADRGDRHDPHTLDPRSSRAQARKPLALHGPRVTTCKVLQVKRASELWVCHAKALMDIQMVAAWAADCPGKTCDPGQEP